MRFTAVNLTLNLPNVGTNQDCNPGGSVICDPGTKGCDAGMTCVGNSCGGSSATINFDFDARILVADTELKALRTELQKVVKTYAAKGKA